MTSQGNLKDFYKCWAVVSLSVCLIYLAGSTASAGTSEDRLELVPSETLWPTVPAEVSEPGSDPDISLKNLNLTTSEIDRSWIPLPLNAEIGPLKYDEQGLAHVTIAINNVAGGEEGIIGFTGMALPVDENGNVLGPGHPAAASILDYTSGIPSGEVKFTLPPGPNYDLGVMAIHTGRSRSSEIHFTVATQNFQRVPLSSDPTSFITGRQAMDQIFQCLAGKCGTGNMQTTGPLAAGSLGSTALLCLTGNKEACGKFMDL